MIAYTFYETDNRVRRYAETLVRRGDTVHAIVLRREGQPSNESVSGVLLHRVQKRDRDETGPLSYLAKLLVFFLRSAWLLTWQQFKAPYDVIHVHSVPDFLVFAALIPRLMGTKVVLDIHDIVPELYAGKFKVGHDSTMFRLLLCVEKLSMRFSHHVIVANHLWRSRMVERSAPSPGHCSTILNYPDPAVFSFRSRKARSDAEFVICYPGTLSWHQGVDLVVRAIAQLQHVTPKIRLVVLGDGCERTRLLSLAEELGIADRVSITPGVPLEEVAEALTRVDLGVEPKRKKSFANEALSTKILEFMAMGVPVLAANTRVHELYFRDGLVDFFESEDVNDLAAKVAELVRNSGRREALISAGLEFIRQNNWAVKKDEYLCLLDRLRKRPEPAKSTRLRRVA